MIERQVSQANGAQVTDGRRLRRHHNREAVIDALLGLFDNGVYQPSAAEIASRAGLSPRSLFRYFDDIDDLRRAATMREIQRARPLLEVPVAPDAPTKEKIRAFVTARIALFERAAAGARAARMFAPVHPVVAAELAERRAFLRRQVQALFAAELAGRSGALLPVVDVLTSFESYELFRYVEGLSRAGAERAMVAALTVLFDEGDPR
jgi:AcrR family transcriptional regulator